MNTLRKALQKINHACGECGGGGCDNSINKEYWDNQKSHVRIDYKNCKSCSGTGIDIPKMTFGDELQFKDGIKKFIRFSSLFYIVSDGKMEYSYGGEPINLGKPSTLQDILRALQNQDFYYQLGAEGHLLAEKDGVVVLEIDLSKTVETQTQEVTNQLIEILS